MNHDQWLEKADIFALGALDGAELEDFKRHLAACHECARLVSASVELLMRTVTPVAPPPALKESLMTRITPASAGRPMRWAPAAVAVFALAIVGMFIVLKALPRSIGESHTPQMAQILASKEVRQVTLNGLEASPQSKGLLYWNGKICGGCFKFENLKRLSRDRVYQLWAIAGGAPVSLGVFRADEHGHAHVDVGSMDRKDLYQTFAVTVEPAGGVPQPTGAMQLLDKI